MPGQKEMIMKRFRIKKELLAKGFKAEDIHAILVKRGYYPDLTEDLKANSVKTEEPEVIQGYKGATEEVFNENPVKTEAEEIKEPSKHVKEDDKVKPRGILTDYNGITAYCFNCRKKTPLKNKILTEFEGIRGKRVYIKGICSICGHKLSSLVTTAVKKP